MRLFHQLVPMLSRLVFFLSLLFLTQLTLSSSIVTPQEQSSQMKSLKDKAIGKTKKGETIYQGVRGGRYYYARGGQKIYLNAPGERLLGKSSDGHYVYRGPKGGRYYYNDSGDKVYITGKSKITKP